MSNPKWIAALERQKKVRVWIAKNPGRTKEEIAAGVGFDGSLAALKARRMIRAVGSPGKTPQRYFALTMEALRPAPEHINIEVEPGGSKPAEY